MPHYVYLFLELLHISAYFINFFLLLSLLHLIKKCNKEKNIAFI